MKKLWTCSQCGRKFEKKNQVHSCTKFPLDKHFKGKEEIARLLYDELTARIRQEVGLFRVDSIPCCIHLVTNFTFAAVYALKDKIRIHLSLDYKLKNPRIDKWSQMSKNRYLYSLDIKDKKEIDRELMDWLKEAYHLRDRKN